jgi:hypothetical protein
MSGESQPSQEDMLVDRGVDDLLDEGYSPPERRPASHDVGTTAEEMREGETWDQRLAQEEPDLDPSALPTSSDEDVPQRYGEEAAVRTGRLVAPDEGAHEDAEKDEIAVDVGIDGGAASAEEAAMHVIPEEELP